uniref:Retroviral envelope protein GP41-like domain-containing protein n=1 Tax=Corvus moneduloides TaxID=1196302 RepID=A0A8U7N744_CORMO
IVNLILWLIFAIVSAVIILTAASLAVTALTHSIQTAHTVGQALTNITKELQTQENIDKEIMARLDALESALLWVGERLEVQKTHLSLDCDWEHIHNSLYLKNDLSWLNPKNWFPGINSGVWVFIGLSCLAMISLLIFCLVLFNIIRAVKSTQKQVMVTLALSMTPIKTKRGRCEGTGSLVLKKNPEKHERKQITHDLKTEIIRSLQLGCIRRTEQRFSH